MLCNGKLKQEKKRIKRSIKCQEQRMNFWLGNREEFTENNWISEERAFQADRTAHSKAPS